MVQPNDNAQLDNVIPFELVHQKGKDGFQERNEAESDPVRHPLRGVAVKVLPTLQGLERHVGGVQKSSQIYHELDAASKVHAQKEGQKRGNEKVDLGVARLFFQLPESLCSNNR